MDSILPLIYKAKDRFRQSTGNSPVAISMCKCMHSLVKRELWPNVENAETLPLRALEDIPIELISCEHDADEFHWQLCD